MIKPLASLSLDLDDKWSYLKTHGDRGWESYPSYLEVVVPRLLDMLRGVGLRITVFIVGQDAAIERNLPVLASIAAAGHEIGNHSFRHDPWLHLYSDTQLEEELSAAEDAIVSATGVRPTGFRGPGYSLSPAVLASLVRRGYRYDASTLPTFLGPLARMYYFFTARLSRQQRHQRKRLFGSLSGGLRPVRPYWWQIEGEMARSLSSQRRLLEIPVTTMPLLRTPIHVSYLLFLRQFSRAVAWSYWRLAMNLCRLAGIGPSLLLHPLDVLGREDEADLAFFPAMRMPRGDKIAFVRDLLSDYVRRFHVVTLGEHARALCASAENLPIRRVAAESKVLQRVRADELLPAAPELAPEASRQ